MLNKEKGITLIALIVTIVVLIILAGITIAGGIQGIDKANDNKLISDLDKVHHAITERDTKYKLTKDESLLIGTVVKTNNIDVSGLSQAETIVWKMVDFDDVEDPEREYYRVTGQDLVDLGLTSDPTTKTVYVVNYYTGEAYNETQKTTEDGELLYVTSTTEQVSEMGDEIIKKGLIVWYDAENNTGSGHSNTTTVWKDLSGNGNDATLYGFDGTATSGWNSNYLAFDGVNDYVTASAESNGDITVECIVKYNNNNTDTVIYMINAWGTTVKNPSINFYYSNSTSNLWTRFLVPPTDTSAYSEVSTNSFNITNIVSLVTSKNNSRIKVFLDSNCLGEGYSNASFISRFNMTNIKLSIGRWYNQYSYSNQNIYSFRIYNRALSDDEIHHNYLIDKARFGIEE